MNEPVVAGAPDGARVERHSTECTAGGMAVERFVLINAAGVEVSFLNYGGIITSVLVPDRNGTPDDVTLGFDSVQQYLGEHPYFGALIGRYANRIANGRFSLDGVEYTLARNNGPNHLHGGPAGFHARIWSVEPFLGESGAGAVLEYVSPAGEEGYPGTLRVRVTYTLTDANELVLDYDAVTDAPTVVNLTQHTYWNLEGVGGGNVLDHEVTLNASRFVPVDPSLIPTGELRPVAGSPFDFTRATRVGDRIEAPDEQLQRARGYDHTWVLDRQPDDRPSLAARVVEPGSGRVLEVLTTQPGVQFYSGNFLDGTLVGKGGRPYPTRSGLALETQHFPDSPNQPAFPSTVLRPGERFTSTTIFRFGVQPEA